MQAGDAEPALAVDQIEALRGEGEGARPLGRTLPASAEGTCRMHVLEAEGGQPGLAVTVVGGGKMRLDIVQAQGRQGAIAGEAHRAVQLQGIGIDQVQPADVDAGRTAARLQR